MEWEQQSAQFNLQEKGCLYFDACSSCDRRFPGHRTVTTLAHCGERLADSLREGSTGKRYDELRRVREGRCTTSFFLPSKDARKHVGFQVERGYVLSHAGGERGRVHHRNCQRDDGKHDIFAEWELICFGTTTSASNPWLAVEVGNQRQLCQENMHDRVQVGKLDHRVYRLRMKTHGILKKCFPLRTVIARSSEKCKDRMVTVHDESMGAQTGKTRRLSGWPNQLKRQALSTQLGEKRGV